MCIKAWEVDGDKEERLTECFDDSPPVNYYLCSLKLLFYG